MEPPLPPMSSSDIHMSVYKHQLPLFDIDHPTNNDVLCGRGVTTNRHVGNENFRSLVNCNKELYVTSTKKQKMRISRSIVDAVRSLDPPGRFLEKDQKFGKWFDIGDKKAVEKTSQALRDGAASLRKQLSEDLDAPEFLSAVFDGEGSNASTGTASSAVKIQSVPGGKKKPPAKGHRRTKSNPTALSAVKAKAAIKKHKMETPMSPNRLLHSSISHRPPLSPMSPRGAHPMSPRSMAHSVSPHGIPPGAHSGHRRVNSMPSVSHPMPSSPVYRDRYLYSPSGPVRSSSYERGQEHYKYGPQPLRSLGSPLSPSLPPPHSSSSHHTHQHPPHPFHTNSPTGYGRPRSNSPYYPSVSPRWSPHNTFNHSAPSLSPHPYLHLSDLHNPRSPDFRPPLGLSPRAPYPRGGSSQFGSASSLSVPALGAERSHDHPLTMSPMRYPPPSPRSGQRQSPTTAYRQASPVWHEFSPPLHQQSPLGRRSRMKSPVEGENEYGPDDEEMQDWGVNHRKGNDLEEVKLPLPQRCASKSNSPAAVADVVSSEKSSKVERKSPAVNGKVSLYERVRDYREYNEDDYPSDEDPMTEEMRMSPLPFNEDEDPSSFMDMPDIFLSLPISPCGPSDCEI